MGLAAAAASGCHRGVRRTTTTTRAAPTGANDQERSMADVKPEPSRSIRRASGRPSALTQLTPWSHRRSAEHYPVQLRLPVGAGAGTSSWHPVVPPSRPALDAHPRRCESRAVQRPLGFEPFALGSGTMQLLVQKCFTARTCLRSSHMLAVIRYSVYASRRSCHEATDGGDDAMSQPDSAPAPKPSPESKPAPAPPPDTDPDVETRSADEAAIKSG